MAAKTPESGAVNLYCEGHIARLCLERPQKLNALTPQMLVGLDAALAALEDDAAVRVVLLEGAGERAFCVGADIEAWSGLTPEEMWRVWTARGHRIFDRLAGLRQPVIALLHGYVFGGGLELALAADLRLGAEGMQCAMPEVGIATFPGWGGTRRLPALIGGGRARQMIFTGERVDAKTAVGWGLVNEAVAGDQLAARGRQLAAAIAQKAPLAVQLAKQALNAAEGRGVTAALEGMGGGLSAASQDAVEGLAAYKEKRPAVFKGK